MDEVSAELQHESALGLCRLLSLADSALPVGGLAHSWGLEESVHQGRVNEANLDSYLSAWCEESLRLELQFVAAAHKLHANGTFASYQWEHLSDVVSAFKTNREGRQSSLRLGGRLLQLLRHQPSCDLDLPRFGHYAMVFGLAGSQLGLAELSTLVAYGNQSLTGLVSAAQRLLPVGQIAATKLNWSLKDLLVKIAMRACDSAIDEAQSFAPLLDIASMSHPYTPVRLFLT